MRAASCAWVVLAVAAVVGCGSSTVTPTTPGQVAISAPVPELPASGAELLTLRPTFVVRNATSAGAGARTYEFQVSEVSDFTTTADSQGGVAEGSGTTSFTPAADLPGGRVLYWRARAHQDGSSSPWSSTAQVVIRIGGSNRAGALFDSLVHGVTIGQRVGSITDMGARGMRVDDPNSWIKYQLVETLTSGEISVEVEGLAPNHPNGKSRIFSMMDGAPTLFQSPYLFNVQYRGANGNPDNAVSFKLLHGGEAFKYEPSLGERQEGVRILNPGTTYLWTATWGSAFRLTIREGGASGPVIYDRTMSTPGTYSPTPHAVYLGANDAAFEAGSFAGAIYRNLWVGRGPRPSAIDR